MRCSDKGGHQFSLSGRHERLIVLRTVVFPARQFRQMRSRHVISLQTARSKGLADGRTGTRRPPFGVPFFDHAEYLIRLAGVCWDMYNIGSVGSLLASLSSENYMFVIIGQS